jgi:hypothetical protein
MKQRKFLNICLGILVILIFVAGNVSAQIIRRTPEGVETSYSTIQEAIIAATSGDTVYVAAGDYDIGTYTLQPWIEMKDGVSLIGAGKDVCKLFGANGQAVIICSGIGNTTIIEGFTITHLLSDGTQRIGRGIFCGKNSIGNSSSLTIRNNIITGNIARSGGGGICCVSSSPAITNNIITGNSAASLTNPSAVDLGGGGILCKEYSSLPALIINNTVTGNSTTARGGGISCYKCSPTIAGNLVAGNSADYYGGGISCEGISGEISSPDITNNTIAKNSSAMRGSGIFGWYSDSSIANNIVAWNTTTATSDGAGVYGGYSSLSINYNDVFGNTIPGNITKNYYGCTPGAGCISLDPLLAAPELGDYHLKADPPDNISPCIDEGNNYYTELAELDFDLDGNPRISHDTVDMGAYEYVISNYYYTITPYAGPGGKILPPDPVEVEQGGNRVFTIEPDEGYHIADVTVDETSVGAVSSYAFSDVTADHEIEASFAINTYTITPSAGAGGSIFPSASVTVEHGGSSLFTITPDPGYHIADVTVDGTSVGAVSSYSFSNVTADHTIEALFAINTYAITPSAGAGGSISPSASVTVEHGGSSTFTITADTGYQIADVTVDGASVGALDSYTFTNVTADHEIKASFKAVKTYTIRANADKGGTISPSGHVTVNRGDSCTFTITPDEGYQIDRVKVDGRSVGAVSSYTFKNVKSNHEIEASFEIEKSRLFKLIEIILAILARIFRSLWGR